MIDCVLYAVISRLVSAAAAAAATGDSIIASGGRRRQRMQHAPWARCVAAQITDEWRFVIHGAYALAKYFSVGGLLALFLSANGHFYLLRTRRWARQVVRTRLCIT